jgi:hypothetical protein
MGLSTRPIAIRRLREVRLKDRFQDQACCGLHHPVPYGGNAEWTSLAVRLQDEYPSHRLRRVLLREQLLVQRRHQCRSPPGRGRDLLDRDPVHPWGAVVVGDQVPGGGKHVEPSDQPIQGVKPERRLSLRFLVQRLSQREQIHGQALLVDHEGRREGRQRRFLRRSGNLLPQSALHVSDSAFCRQGRFAPRPLRRFPATIAPSDSRPGPADSLCIPSPPFRGTTPARRGSQVPRLLVRDAPSPFTPESRVRTGLWVDRLPLIHFRTRAGFTRSGGLATFIFAFRGLREFTCVTAHLFASRGFDRPIARHDRPLGSMCHRHFT